MIARAAGVSRSAVADAFAADRVRRNGEPIKPSAALDLGDRVVYDIVPQPPLVAVAEPIPLDIVFEDDAVLVVNKPAGLVTHPAHGARERTLVGALLAHVAALPGDPLRPGLVHRLDRDTSGLLVVAKTERALRILGKAMEQRYVEREYLGLVRGIPENARGTIEGAIGRDPQNRLRYTIRADGKSAVTHFELREPLARASELCFRLETGRTHQIRVHMAAFGYPIVGDPVYGVCDPRVTLSGQALHAWRLRFRHPETFTPLSFEIDPPPAYVAARAALRTP